MLNFKGESMIPRTIHYCWFGGEPLPTKVKRNIESWKKQCPNYEIIQWNESNYDTSSNDYISQAYERGKYAFVTDYARLDIIQKHGGIYLDTDVELIKPLDYFLDYDAFFAMEEAGTVATGLGFGAVENSDILEKLKKQYDGQSFFDNGKENLKTCIEYSAPIFEGLGISNDNKTQYFDKSRIAVFATEVFCPQSLETGKTTITSKTVSIHHYDSSWKKHPSFSKYLTKYKIRIRKAIDYSFGSGTYNRLKNKLKH